MSVMSAGTTRIGPMETEGNNTTGGAAGGSAIITMHSSSSSFDMEQRDPNNLNHHLQVSAIRLHLIRLLHIKLRICIFRFNGMMLLVNQSRSAVTIASGIVLTKYILLLSARCLSLLIALMMY